MNIEALKTHVVPLWCTSYGILKATSMKIEGITMKESIELTQIAIILLVMVMRWYMLLLGPRSTLLLSASSGFVFVVCCLLRNATFPKQLGRVNSKTMDCFKVTCFSNCVLNTQSTDGQGGHPTLLAKISPTPLERT